MFPLQAEGAHEERMPSAPKSLRSAEKITTSNRFSELQDLHSDLTVPDSHPEPVFRSPITTRASAVPFVSPLPHFVRTPPVHHRIYNSSSPVHREINQLTLPRPSSILIKLAGTVAGQPAVFLIDCGADGNFVSSSFLPRLSSPPVVLPSSNTITLADGRTQPVSGVASSVPVRL